MRLILFVLLCIASGFFPTWAQAPVQPAALIGKWTSTAQHPSGASIKTVVTMTQNKKFVGAATVNGKPLLDYAGSWSLDGKRLSWTFEKSSRPEVAAGTVDTDEVVAVDANKLVLLSKLSGRQRVYERVR